MYSDKIDVSAILKLLDIRFEEYSGTLLDKIVNYVDVMNKLMKIKCFVFVHLLSFLTEYEMEKLYEFVWYQKIHILLIEDHQPRNVDQFSKAVIIDKDTCEIFLHML